MTPDPYPDLAAGEAPDTAVVGDDPAAAERPELDEADSRLLAALSQAGPAVVTAVEDQPRTTRPATARGRSPLAPVFREPTG